VLTLSQQIWVPFSPNGPSVYQSGVLEFSKFNPALGTLLAADMEVGYGIYTVYLLTNPTANPLRFGGYMDAHLSVAGYSRWFSGVEGSEYLAAAAQKIAYPSVHFPAIFNVMAFDGLQGTGKVSIPYTLFAGASFGIQDPGIKEYLYTLNCYPCDPATSAGLRYSLRYVYDSSTATVVPEPASLTLFATTTVGLTWFAWRRRTRSGSRGPATQ
jgi:hypothetical protein